jgi:hypothetical protein
MIRLVVEQAMPPVADIRRGRVVVQTRWRRLGTFHVLPMACVAADLLVLRMWQVGGRRGEVLAVVHSVFHGRSPLCPEMMCDVLPAIARA